MPHIKNQTGAKDKSYKTTWKTSLKTKIQAVM